MGGRSLWGVCLLVVVVSAGLLIAWTIGAAANGRARLVGAPAFARVDRGWRRPDLRAVTQPVAVGNRFVFYAAHGKGLRVIALDARTGATAWTTPATPSAIAPGVGPDLAVIGGEVFYLAKGGGSLAELVARSVQGGVRWRSAPGAFATWPTVCPDSATAICLTGILSTSAQRGVELRFDAQTGKQLPGALISKGFGARELAPGLFDPGQRHPELLLATRGAQVRWRRPLAAVFTLRGASTDWGWNFDRAAARGLFVGSPGSRPIKLSSTRFVVDLSRNMTAGFRISNGTVAWRSPGMYVCNYLPCPGAGEAGFSAPGNARGSGPTVGLRTRAFGTVRGSFNGLPVASRSTRVTLEGFDPATGRTIWRYDAGHDPGLITQRLLPPRLGTRSIALPNGRRRVVALDLLHGNHHQIAPSTAAWCRTPILYKQRTAYPAGNGARLSTYIGQLALYPCTAQGRRRTTPAVVPSFVAAIGAQSNGLIAWTDTKAVVAVPAR